ncbi:arabinosyltransferase domain-containing protein [Rhodococcus sp. NPDC049939]|uniref:arabinosyltransferase domain-containing protein n=1 Tax=Rhodococcus sp. NPDC049939 TaxID=3155511 RepID=UPI003410975C
MRTFRILAITTGLLGFLLALAIPFLPVKQDAASIDWPQNGVLNSVEAPLVSYTPLNMQVSIPCSAFTHLEPEGGTVLSTLPDRAPDFEQNGLVIKSSDDATVDVVIRGTSLISANLADLQGCATISVTSDYQRTSAEITGLAQPVTGRVDGDWRPQMVGLFTDLQGTALGNTEGTALGNTEGTALGELNVHVDIDSRFSSSPTTLKLLVMAMCVLATLTSLYALHRIDGIDGRRARRFLPAHWWKFTGVDAVVIGTLVLWHIIGANTSDDGYILGMARASEHSGYMANYFRWFGVPEAPFGWSYELLALMANVSTASMWMRLPTLLAGLLCWMLISREVIPRLGVAVRHNRTALWTGGLVFVAFWLPYNNGLRPEPVIAVGALLTWCSVERAIATGRLLPAAVAVLIAAFSLAAGPSGLICVAALLAGGRPIFQIMITRARQVGLAPQIMPILAAGTVVLVVVFADQTLATVRESTRVRSAVGPNVAWFDERQRWDALLSITPDGSLARRFGVLVMLLCVVVCVVLILRKGRVPGAAVGPSRRILGIVFASLLLMMFTPTKWTHHFGVYAGLAGSVAVLTAVGIGAASVRSKRNQTLFTAGILFILALTFTGSNSFWYVSSYGVPWFDQPPMIGGKGFSTVFLGLAVLAVLLAAWFHVQEPFETEQKKQPDERYARILAASPLTIAAAAVVLFQVLSLLKGAVEQYPAYSIAKSDIESVGGDTCGLAEEVLVETDPTSALLPLLTPVTDLDGAGAFGATDAVGFTPGGVPPDLSTGSELVAVGDADTVDTANYQTTSSETGGGDEAIVGINGSTVALPFGLDPARTPVLGSYQPGGRQQSTSIITGWYGLPERSDDAPILTISVAGRIHSVDAVGFVTPGQTLSVEYGFAEPDGTVTQLGSVDPIDIGPAPEWRNVRVPLDQIPTDANTVRLIAEDPGTDPDPWLAITPPRVPKMQTLQTVVGSVDPVLVDWAVGLAFPCQRPFDHRYGVAEVPHWRILPDRTNAQVTNGWQDEFGGGPLGWIDQLLSARTLATYLSNDWDRDWGSLERYTPLDEAATPAQVISEQVTRSGIWSPGPVRDQQ